MFCIEPNFVIKKKSKNNLLNFKRVSCFHENFDIQLLMKML